MDLFKIILVWFYEICLRSSVILWSVQICIFAISIFVFYYRHKELGAENVKAFIKSPFLPNLSLFVPAYNEDSHIIKTLSSMLALPYPNLKIVVVNDGSTDTTLEKLIAGFKLIPLPAVIPGGIRTKRVIKYYISSTHSNLLIIDKENGGKADALNAALNISTSPYFVTVDADTFLDPAGFQQAVFHFLTHPNSVAAGSAVCILNENQIQNNTIKKVQFPKKIILGIQSLEYMRSFFQHRAGAGTVGGNIILPGAFSIFNRKEIVSIGGYPTDTVTEDLEITLRLHKQLKKEKKPYIIDFVPTLVAWSIVPETWEALFNQRERWLRGTIKALWDHKDMLLNPFYHKIGFIGAPYLLLESLSVFMEIGYYLLVPICGFVGILSWTSTILFISIAVTYSSLMSCLAVFAEELTFARYSNSRDLGRILICGFVECFGFHQWILLARLQAYWKCLRGNKEWRMKRKAVQQPIWEKS